jgi:hypothetical protein
VTTEGGFRDVILAAMAAARQRQHAVFAEHVLFGLATSNDQTTREALKLLGITRERVAALIDDQDSFLYRGPILDPDPGPLFTSRAKRLLDSWREEAAALGHLEPLASHLLLH